jgi:hypothetical protein
MSWKALLREELERAGAAEDEAMLDYASSILSVSDRYIGSMHCLHGWLHAVPTPQCKPASK